MEKAAAGEALLAKGVHGSYGAFMGFLLLALGSIGMSWGMLSGAVFSKAAAWVGLIGNCLLGIYIIQVTFVPAVKNTAMLIAAPRGLMALAWMIMFTGKLFKLAGGK